VGSLNEYSEPVKASIAIVSSDLAYWMKHYFASSDGRRQTSNLDAWRGTGDGALLALAEYLALKLADEGHLCY
jgi:hypothetical protein